MQAAQLLIGKAVADEDFIGRSGGVTVTHSVALRPQACPRQKLQKAQLQKIADGKGFIKGLGKSFVILTGQARDQIRVDVDIAHPADAIQGRKDLRRIGVPINGAKRIRVGGLHAAFQLDPPLGHSRQRAEVLLVQQIGAHLKMIGFGEGISGQRPPDGIGPPAIEIEGAIHEFDDGHAVHGFKLRQLPDRYLSGFCPHTVGGGGQAVGAAEGTAS